MPKEHLVPDLCSGRGLNGASHLVVVTRQFRQSRFKEISERHVMPNVKMSGLRGFLRRFARLPGWSQALPLQKSNFRSIANSLISDVLTGNCTSIAEGRDRLISNLLRCRTRPIAVVRDALIANLL